MSKFKVEHGASKINLVLLKTNIEDTISQDIELMATWSDNDRKYIVNELLRFALSQSEEFQKYKAGQGQGLSKKPNDIKSIPSVTKASPEAAPKPASLAATTTSR